MIRLEAMLASDASIQRRLLKRNIWAFSDEKFSQLDQNWIERISGSTACIASDQVTTGVLEW